MKALVIVSGIVLGAVVGVIGLFVALGIGLGMAGEYGDHSTGADLLFLAPFVVFAVISSLGILIPAVRRSADGLLAAAGATSAVVLVAAGAVLVFAGFQRL